MWTYNQRVSFISPLFSLFSFSSVTFHLPNCSSALKPSCKLSRSNGGAQDFFFGTSFGLARYPLRAENHMPHQGPLDNSQAVPPPKTKSLDFKAIGTDRNLELEFGRCYQPKIGGRARGEDANFISVGCRAFSVADGVGGWCKHGVDAGRFARQLMRYSKASIEEFSFCRSSVSYLSDILESALRRTIARGTSTACIGVVDGNLLRVANIGDSGVAVVRDGAMAFRSPPGQKHFNYPYQIGRKTPRHSLQVAENFSLELVPGDVVVVATDGLFDNLYDWEIAALLTRLLSEEGPSATAKEMASALTKAAVETANDAERESPFAKASQATRFCFTGGKEDDVTVIVVKVMLTEENVMHTDGAPLPAPTSKKPPIRRHETAITKPKDDPDLSTKFSRLTLADKENPNTLTSPNRTIQQEHARRQRGRRRTT